MKEAARPFGLRHRRLENVWHAFHDQLDLPIPEPLDSEPGFKPRPEVAFADESQNTRRRRLDFIPHGSQQFSNEVFVFREIAEVVDTGKLFTDQLCLLGSGQASKLTHEIPQWQITTPATRRPNVREDQLVHGTVIKPPG